MNISGRDQCELALRTLRNKGIDSNVKTLSSEELKNFLKNKNISDMII